MSPEITLPILAHIIQPSRESLTQDWQDRKITGIETDTRVLKPGEVFVALVGEKFDGHHFLENAVRSRASALILNQDFSGTIPDEIPQFYVQNTLTAYQKIAHWWRQQHQIPVIGITGSVGKTTTKELIAGVLSRYGKVLKTEGNYNNEIGVPKTLLRLNAEHDYAVVEMAMRAKGEIAQLTDITQPTIGLITNVGTAHIGRLGSRSAIAQAKCELLAQMPKTATAILNHDNQRLINTAATVWEGNTLTYGLEGGDIHGRLIDSETLAVDDFNFPLPLAGTHNASNYLAAITVAKALNLDLTPLQAGIEVTLPGARSRRHVLPNDILFLDETYNAGVESMIASLQLLKDTPGKRHLAVLGTMKELGSESASLHSQVGDTIARLHLDHLLVLVDEPETEAIATAATAIKSECFEDKNALVNRLREILTPGDRVLFKASHSVGLDQVLAQFIN
ncbi:UDP-N-acetylmuramoyl-tripeptide--D-alanyl-D-alanine ligase [Dactylococcopsis salina]|uniref:UDP-N-acetylmuramoyl-tripeptide--D-alanyl-D-alanine ligase n=1 Tax=Dactylococcopsis salina (strain PCC 8305) TaxID=13035 RepID=K9YT62_DACS8|nr:UDP-N-acetylmuramoyl-tripeptide--D-alanyl-D-alanine ligase [Dactylococcopsis salina]AFZ49550.1 UDP-N-acetylmuramoyl-tripeptide--D-alanyl-D-alanine ligase [Dactylococcopsis salina PCC 8305]